MNEIPPIVDPMGKHWRQPRAEDILIDATHALMTTKTLAELGEYSTSFPSGVYDGKMWKRNEGVFIKGGSLLLCWYGPSDEPGSCLVNSRKIITV